MKRRTLLALMPALLLALLLATSALTAPAPAAAAPPERVEGDFTVEAVIPTSIHEAGSNCILQADVVFSFSGDVEGMTTLPLRLIRHGSCDPTVVVPENFHGMGTFTGTVNGVAGSFDHVFAGRADDEGNATARMTVLRGSGGLAGLHGRLTLEGEAGVGGAYEGRVH